MLPMLPDESTLADLRARWDSLTREILEPSRRAAAFERIAAQYAEPHRHYHNLQHIAECFVQLDAARTLAREPTNLEWAIWFHDIVYDPRSSENEMRSAELADQMLKRFGLDDATRAAIARLILATRHDRIPNDPDERLIADVDLSILGQPPQRYDEYARAIREEHRHLDDRAFRHGRAAVLRQFLQRPRIFGTDFFRDRFELHARDNLERELDSLRWML